MNQAQKNIKAMFSSIYVTLKIVPSRADIIFRKDFFLYYIYVKEINFRCNKINNYVVCVYGDFSWEGRPRLLLDSLAQKRFRTLMCTVPY